MHPYVRPDSEGLLRDFPQNRRYLIGVSGGRDSTALLYWLIERGYKKLVVCHLDHQLRGRASRTDARFVEKMVHAAALDCEIGSTDVRALAKESKLSIETAARVARFAFFVSVARKKHCRSLFLAHHADDLVETALLNLFRGGSPGGIASLRSVSVHRIGKTELTVVRPLLDIWRSEIDAYVKQRHLPFREDASNVQLSATRNRIRHRILPYIEKQFGRDVRLAIWRAAQIWRSEEEILDAMMEGNNFTAVEIEVKRLRDLPPALQRRALVRWLRSRHITDVGFELVESVRALIDPNATRAKVNLPGNRHARRRAGKLFIS